MVKQKIVCKCGKVIKGPCKDDLYAKCKECNDKYGEVYEQDYRSCFKYDNGYDDDWVTYMNHVFDKD